MKRKIIQIDEEKCNGCGQCADACAEGAIEIIDGKARLVKDEYCDGLGACIGQCPEDAIEFIEREAKEFDEEATNKHLAKIKKQAAVCNCPSSQPKKFNSEPQTPNPELLPSNLTNWPIQLKLVPVKADFFNDEDILLSADCAAFTDANFHQKLLKGKKLIIGCPKLDDADFYTEKLGDIIKENEIKSITVAHIEVPCCTGLIHIAKKAIEKSEKNIPLKTIEVKIRR